MIQWWRDFRDFGVLPHPGDMNAQPAYVYQAIRACHDQATLEERRTLASVGDVT